jgi:hypothetical protein
MENKTGRKYDRKRWGWKEEVKKYDDEVSRYDNYERHAYYDSDKRRKNEEAFFWFLTIAGGCMVGMILGGLVIKLIF